MRGDVRLRRKGAIIVVWLAASYGMLLAWRLPSPCQVLLCLSYALAACALAFNVFHDANHGAWSERTSTNLALSRMTCIVLGPARFFWRYKHHTLHHRGPNVSKWDDDVESRGFLRLSPQQPWRPRYRYQHRFAFLLYAFNTIEWVFIKDFVQLLTGRLNEHQATPTMSRSDILEFWTCKLAHFAGFVLLPFMFHPALEVLVALGVVHVAMGFILTVVFQLAHLNEHAAFPAAAEGSRSAVDSDWGAHQLLTTMNFATQSRVINWFTGGLNFQIEHHLFPAMSHTYYPEVSAIVRSTVAEFGLPYHYEVCLLDGMCRLLMLFLSMVSCM
jgi:linoleoyl-CoA desaturase